MVRRRAGWLAFVLAVTPRWGAPATNALARGQPRAFARRDTLVARSAARGGAHVTCTRRRGTTAGSQRRRTATTSTRTWEVQELRAVAGVLTRDLANLRPSPERAVVRGHSRACHARPRHARSAQPSGDQRCSSRRAVAQPPIPAQEFYGSTAGSTKDPRTATAGLKGMSGPGVPSRRGAAVLRRDGQHTGKVNRATHLDVAGASQE
jgi:hypothetical protein